MTTTNHETAIEKTTARTPATIGAELTVDMVIDRKRKIDQVMRGVMQDGVHFGKIPGCGDKPSLFKAGAEVLATTFGLAPSFIVDQTNLPDGHREYRVTCSLRHIASGANLGEGVGSCSTMEKKYRIRGGRPNPDLADTYNTILKMAKKRAQVDATLTAVGASDILTQDIEDMGPEEREPQRDRRPANDVQDAEFTEQPRAGLRERIEGARTVDELKACFNDVERLPEKHEIDGKPVNVRKLARDHYAERLFQLSRKAG